MEEVLEKLNQHQSETPSKWREEAEFRRANKSWIRRSQKIAVKILSKIVRQQKTSSCLFSKCYCYITTNYKIENYYNIIAPPK
ncbi:MAG: hypothetical protein J1E95_09945 [Muribaculaceae bacterium]|nr:hypothetical protein [Muribaculaceae bacterium]